MFSYLMFSFISAVFDSNEKYVNKVMSIRIFIVNLHVLCFDINDVPAYEHWN